MQVQTKNFISFKAISLSKDEKKRSDKLLSSIDNPAIKEQAKIDLFEIFDSHLQKESEMKAGWAYRKEDLLQKLYLIFLESLENIKSLTTDKLIEILNSTKPNEEEMKEEYRIKTYSINKKRSHIDERTIETKLSEDKIPEPLSNISPEERTKKLKEIQDLSETLSLEEQDLLKKRAEGKFYKTIAQEVGLSETRTQYKTKSAIAKIQLHNNELPAEYGLFTDEFIKEFNLSLSREKVINLIINNLQIMNYDIKSIAENVNKTSKLLEIDRNSYIPSILKFPQLLYLKPETISNNIDEISKQLEVDRKIFVKAALKHSSLLYTKSETILDNVKSSSKLLEIDKKVFIQAALKQPQLFYQKPETIFNNIDEIAKLLEIDKKVFIQLALTQPQLFYKKPETISNNINKISKLTKIDRKSLIAIALKQPTLFLLNPEVAARKINIIKYFKKVKGKDNDKGVFRTLTDDKLFYKILTYLIKKQDGLKKMLKENEMVEYLKSQTKVYNLTIPAHEVGEDFIKYVQEFSKSNIGKQIFNITVK